MVELTSQLHARVEEARRSLVEARRAGDDYLVDVLLGELEELGRLAREHGVEIDGLEPWVA